MRRWAYWRMCTIPTTGSPVAAPIERMTPAPTAQFAPDQKRAAVPHTEAVVNPTSMYTPAPVYMHHRERLKRRLVRWAVASGELLYRQRCARKALSLWLLTLTDGPLAEEVTQTCVISVVKTPKVRTQRAGRMLGATYPCPSR
jgi:hypothetical protein